MEYKIIFPKEEFEHGAESLDKVLAKISEEGWQIHTVKENFILFEKRKNVPIYPRPREKPAFK